MIKITLVFFVLKPRRTKELKIKTLEESGKRTDSRLKEFEQKLEQNLNAGGAVRPEPGTSYQVDPAPVSDPFYSKGSSENRTSGASDRKPPDSAKTGTGRSQVGKGLSENALYALAKQAFDRSEFQTASSGSRHATRWFPTCASSARHA